MRHLLALLTLAFALVACDESTTAPADTIPGPPNAPRLKVTVLTGTKDAPSDTPTVRIQWWYTDSVMLGIPQNLDRHGIGIIKSGIGDTIVPIAYLGGSVLTIPGSDTIPSQPLLAIEVSEKNNHIYSTLDTSNHVYFKKK